MSKGEERCGHAWVDGLKRWTVKSVAGIALGTDELVYVFEHENGGCYWATTESGYCPPPERITTPSKAFANAEIVACGLVGKRLERARKAAVAVLGQGELDLRPDAETGAEPRCPPGGTPVYCDPTTGELTAEQAVA